MIVMLTRTTLTVLDSVVRWMCGPGAGGCGRRVVRGNYHYPRIRYNDTKSERGIHLLVESARAQLLLQNIV